MQNEINNSIEKNKLFEVENPNDTIRISLLGKALSAPVRIQMIRLINKRNMLASEIAAELNLPLSSAIFHLNILEEAGIVQKVFSTKRKGTQHWYTFGSDIGKTATIQFRAPDGSSTPKALVPYVHNINIGHYVDAEFSPNCGIATEEKQIMGDNPNLAFVADHHKAQIIWSRNFGSLLYALPNAYAVKGKLSEINFSLELCSEALGFNHDYPSDVTFCVNGKEICTYTVPGDYGDRYGKFTPPWWFPESTKYGLLINISIRERGVFVNEKPVNKSIGLSDLALSEGNRTTFGLKVKKDAEHLGGFNIFGEKFGDYNQGIIFTATYKSS